MLNSCSQGYRCCLTVVRIHPETVITFNKAAFLGLRGSSPAQETDRFLARLLDCMFFTHFISSRGLPWRECDLFDAVHSTIGRQVAEERRSGDPGLVLGHISSLAAQLSDLDTAGCRPRLPLPTRAHMRSVPAPVFPSLDPGLVASIMQEKAPTDTSPHQSCNHHKTVPSGPPMTSSCWAANQQELDTLCKCVEDIFENKISSARESLPSVLCSLKRPGVRRALCGELRARAVSSETLLEHAQFHLVARLMNAALQEGEDTDMFGVAAALLPLASTFGRKLGPGVVQFVYTLVQEHGVWRNIYFWQNAFYKDVEEVLKNLYLNDLSGLSGEPSALDVAAAEMIVGETLEKAVCEEKSMKEEHSVYSQAIVFISQMVSVLMPLNFKTKVSAENLSENDRSDNKSLSNSVFYLSETESSSSVFDVSVDTAVAPAVEGAVRLVSRFVDLVCGDTRVSPGHQRALLQLVTEVVVPGHSDTLAAVAERVSSLQEAALGVFREAVQLELLQTTSIVTFHSNTVFHLLFSS